jgi:23S rRNA maturation-related 3'-5' exoribonuclease YhaM
MLSGGQGSRMDRVDTELQGLVNRIADPELRGRVFELLDDPTIDIDDRTYRGVSFDASPAAKRAHHAHLRGLLQHTVAASKIALTLCDVVEEVPTRPLRLSTRNRLTDAWVYERPSRPW